MGFEAVVGLLLVVALLGLTAHNNRKHRQYRESIGDALTRGEIAKEAVEDLKVEITALNEKLSHRSHVKKDSRQRLMSKRPSMRQKLRCSRMPKKCLS